MPCSLKKIHLPQTKIGKGQKKVTLKLAPSMEGTAMINAD